MIRKMIAVDVGGTFTDLVLKQADGSLNLFKSSTTPSDPVEGVLNVLSVAAESLGCGREELLAETDLFVHGTTRGLNAVLTGATAKTALLTTKGHRDLLVFREGGRPDPFDFTVPFPKPFVPRELTFEIPERIDAQGRVVEPLDEGAVRDVAARLAEIGAEAVAVCLLWSVIAPEHELAVERILAEVLPDVPVTLSHQINPVPREYRRASSAAIDASLKPVMSAYMESLQARLGANGFAGRVLIMTGAGGVLDIGALAAKPIHSLGSGPAMAPVAGKHYASVDTGYDTVVVADAGGTSYDVSVVRRGEISWTRETWVGGRYLGHMTGFPSVDVVSIGAGGGSIASVDSGGLLHVGPESAGADPGPVCYGKGGEKPTVTDAALVLGYLDPDFFLGGALQLDVAAARTAIEEQVARPLGLGTEEAAAAVMQLASEHMVQIIEEITINQGLDIADAVMVVGGGAAGLNAVAIAKRLRAKKVIFPQVAAALSAAGALMSDLSSDYAVSHFTTSRDFDFEGVRKTLADLTLSCRQFFDQASQEGEISYFAEARYPDQAWELEVALPVTEIDGEEDVEAIRQAFHKAHREVFAIDDPASPIEIVAWRARASVPVASGTDDRPRVGDQRPSSRRRAYWPDGGAVEIPVRVFEGMSPGEGQAGPAVIESSITTVVLDPGSYAERTASGSLLITLGTDSADEATAASGNGREVQ